VAGLSHGALLWVPQLLKLRHRVYLVMFTMLLPAGGAALPFLRLQYNKVCGCAARGLKYLCCVFDSIPLKNRG